MASATIQFSQGSTTGEAGKSVIGFVTGSPVTMTDVGGPATSRTWSWVNWPSPLSTPPAILNATSQEAQCTPTLDGVYIVKLTRVELDETTTTDIRYFGVPDEFGLILPTAGMTGGMSNIGPDSDLAVVSGWAGRADAGTNVFLDAILRHLLHPFSIASFTKTSPNGSQTLYRRGATLSSIAMAATYNSGPPTTAALAHTFGGSSDPGDINPGTWTFAGPAYSSGSLAGSVKRSGLDTGADPTMTVTLTATKGSVKTYSVTLTWTSDVWWGVGTAGLSTEAEIKALASTTLQTSRNRTFTVSPSDQKVYYAYPKNYGVATFTLNGFPAAFNAPSEVSLTNVNGVTRTYYLYESVNLLTGTNLSFVVT